MDIPTLFNLDGLLPANPEPLALSEQRRDDKKSQDEYNRAYKAHKMIEDLQGPYQTLDKTVQRKFSDIITAPASEKELAAEELLNTVIDQREKVADMHRVGKASLHHQFQCGVLSKEDFHKKLRDIQHKQRKLFAGDVTIRLNRGRVLRNIRGTISQFCKDPSKAGRELGHLFYHLLLHKTVDREAEQKMFSQDLIGYYECQPGGCKKNMWCPISKDWFPSGKMRAAHIVPYKIGYQTMGDLFGEEARGHELMWSMGNGMMIHSDFEEAFDKHTFCLIPVEKPGNPDGWKIVLIDEGQRFKKVLGRDKWDRYDGTELEFLNDNRPSRRFLYFHYFFCVYRAMQERRKGWQNAREKSGTRKLWATPGPYLRASMLRTLAGVIEDNVELPEELVTDGEIKDLKLLEPETEMLDAKDLASTLLRKKDFRVARTVEYDEGSEESEESEDTDGWA